MTNFTYSPRTRLHTSHNRNIRTSAIIKILPLLIIMAYLFSTFFLFMIWPINWPIYDSSSWIILSAYIISCFIIIIIGFQFGSKSQFAHTHTQFPWYRTIIFGAIFAIIILFPSSILYTGRWPWQFLQVIQFQNEAYKALQYQLIETAGQRGPLAAIRALLSPLTFAVIPLGIIHWRTLPKIGKGFVIATAFASIIFSTLRGTDRELADLFIISGSATLVAIGRGGASQGLSALKRYWKPALAIILFLYVAATVFTERKGARLGGYEQRISVCANDSNICTDIDAPLINWMPLSQRFGVSFFILSTCSGYYGLQLAMEKPFHSTYGLGHSPAIMSLYTLFTEDKQLSTRTYTYRNSIEGWVEENYWSSLITWLANDVGFIGALFVLAWLGWLWGKTWYSATVGGSDPAAVLFCLVMVMLFYLPANNQVFASYDGYVTFFVWMIIWIRQISTSLRNKKIDV